MLLCLLIMIVALGSMGAMYELLCWLTYDQDAGSFYEWVKNAPESMKVGVGSGMLSYATAYSMLKWLKRVK